MGSGRVVSPDTDPYDPTKPEYIVPASNREIVEESAKQRRQQIDRLENALSHNEGHRSTKPRVLLRYRQYLRELQPGRRAQPGVLREARDVPMPPVEGRACPGQFEGGPPTHSTPACVLTQLVPAAGGADAAEGETPVPERAQRSPQATASLAPSLPRTSSSPALPFQAASGIAGSLGGYRTCSSSSSMPA